MQLTCTVDMYMSISLVQGLVPGPGRGDVIVQVPVTVGHIATREGAVADDLFCDVHISLTFSLPTPTHFCTT